MNKKISRGNRSSTHPSKDAYCSSLGTYISSSGGSMVILEILLVFACIVACGVLLVGITKD